MQYTLAVKKNKANIVVHLTSVNIMEGDKNFKKFERQKRIFDAGNLICISAQA